MSWKIGQKLVCVGGFYTMRPDCAPKPNDIVTYNGSDSDGYIYLFEFNIPNPYFPQKRVAYKSKWFRPAIGPSAKSELIEKFVEVEEKSDCPIQVPETV